MEQRYVVILVTVSGIDTTRKISQTPLAKIMAACVSIITDVSSSFQWQGNIDTAKENLLIIKTKAGLLNEIITQVKQIHTDMVPGIIAVLTYV